MRRHRIPETPLAACLGLLALAAVPGAGAGIASVPAPGVGPPLPGARGAPADTLPVGRWTVEDVLLEESAGDYRISPDGTWVVWVRSRMDAGEGRRDADLWLTRIADGASFRLTRGPERDDAPRWRPDGEAIVFFSDRELPGADDGEEDTAGGRQLWTLRLPGGEPAPVTRDLRDIRDFAWKGATDTLVVAARESRSRLERELRRREDDARVVEDTLTELPVRLFAVDADGGSPRRLTRNEDWIRSVAVSPDGERAVVVADDDLSYTFDGLNPPHTYLVDLSSGERREVFTGEAVVPYDVQWAPRGDGFYVAYPFSSHPVYRTATVTRMGFYDTAAGAFRRIDLAWDRALGAGYEAVEGGFVAFLADGVRYRPSLYRRAGRGWRPTMLSGEHVPHVYDAAVSRDGRWIAYTHSRADRPAQPFVARLREGRLEEPLRLGELNPSFDGKPLPRVEVVRWEGARRETVEGLLYYPLDHDPGRAYPLVLNIHGGPASQDMDRWTQSWADPLVLFNQRGAFVLQVNYHGSANYGLAWVESIGEGNYYDLEVPDIESGVDHLVRRGLVHPDSVATQGWSNGAILSNVLTVQNPDRYVASLAGAGDVEWISDWGNIDFGASFDNYYLGGPPWEIPETYLEKSPFFRLDRVRTPTLIFFGTEDRNVPTGQGWSHFRALQQMGEAPVRFILFPGEPHGLRRLVHQRRKVEEELAWLDRHLWGESAPATLSLEDDAPLGRRLRLAGAARDSAGRYGDAVGGLLVPETIGARGLAAGVAVGRFEVTRAQWRAYDPSYEIPPGTANHPVAGVDFQEARAYVRWLRERTGRPFRLPRTGELEGLAAAAPAGNTLDHWAGYPPNPDDAEDLRDAAARLPGDAPLLRPVGSFAGLPAYPEVSSLPTRRAAEERVYDLNGNVAEWTTGPGGEGVPVGGSADRPVDARSDDPAAPAYRGLRVVQGGG